MQPAKNADLAEMILFAYIPHVHVSEFVSLPVWADVLCVPDRDIRYDEWYILTLFLKSYEDKQWYKPLKSYKDEQYYNPLKRIRICNQEIWYNNDDHIGGTSDDDRNNDCMMCANDKIVRNKTFLVIKKK